MRFPESLISPKMNARPKPIVHMARIGAPVTWNIETLVQGAQCLKLVLVRPLVPSGSI